MYVIFIFIHIVVDLKLICQNVLIFPFNKQLKMLINCQWPIYLVALTISSHEIAIGFETYGGKLPSTILGKRKSH